MQEAPATPILQRLLTVTSDCRAAFAEAAYTVSSPRLAALFMRRAEHQNRIAVYLSEHLASGRGPSARSLPAARGGATRALRAGALPMERDPHVLLGACLRVLDTAILEFARAFAPSMPLGQRISLERHHDQMRWSREELADLQRTYKWQCLSPVSDECEVQPSESTLRWFGTSRESEDRDAWQTQLIPNGATHFHEHESRRTS